ncbi:hypothetical protein [Rhizobium sp. BK376]|uniref:hypothetical protein n=1 Tax=Rhizobium sp. BK376 TaxID=2512149 RepID=UPI00104744B4|nr:hypothetical protein [Rhizobium sp. BK376]
MALLDSQSLGVKAAQSRMLELADFEGSPTLTTVGLASVTGFRTSRVLLSITMSLLTLLSLEDEQIEIVTGALREWSKESGHSVHNQAGREAMEVAVRIAASQRPSQAELPNLLGKLMKVRDISGITYVE